MGPGMSFFLERHGGTFRMLDACKACRAQVEHGCKKCPQCGAKLARPGASLQTAGWVTTIVSLIPLGFVTVKQGPLAPLGLGIAMIMAGVIMIVIGRIQRSKSPRTIMPVTMRGVLPARTAPATQPKEAAADQRTV
jgi:hypothetical protein